MPPMRFEPLASKYLILSPKLGRGSLDASYQISKR